MRKFETGATRDTDSGKFDYEGFLSPLVVERFAAYMQEHRVQPDGNIRDSDNWQRGMPLEVYLKSMFRHFVDLWKEHRGIETAAGIEDALCAVLFNCQGYLHEILKSKRPTVKELTEGISADFSSVPSVSNVVVDRHGDDFEVRLVRR